MKEKLAKQLLDYFAESAILSAGPVTDSEIANLEKWIGFGLPEDYKWFVLHFGGGIVGHLGICGLGASEAMGVGDASAQKKTERFRGQDWPGTEEWLVISSDSYGNPIGIDAGGKIWVSDLDKDQRRLVADSFEEFLAHLLSVQAC